MSIYLLPVLLNLFGSGFIYLRSADTSWCIGAVLLLVADIGVFRYLRQQVSVWPRAKRDWETNGLSVGLGTENVLTVPSYGTRLVRALSLVPVAQAISLASILVEQGGMGLLKMVNGLKGNYGVVWDWGLWGIGTLGLLIALGLSMYDSTEKRVE